MIVESFFSNGSIKIEYELSKIVVTLPHINNLTTKNKVSDEEIKHANLRINSLKDRIKSSK